MANPISSFSGGGVVSHGLQLVDLFLFDVLGRFGCKTMVGITGDCTTSSATLGDYEITYVVSSIIGVGDGISRLDS